MKIAVITGASSGLGVEFLRAAVSLFPEIESFWLIARRRERLLALQEEFPEKALRAVPLDLSSDDALDVYRALLAAEKPDICLLLNNAGFGKLGDFESTPCDEQLSMVELNCRALTAITSLSLPYMKEGAHVMNISSIASFAPTPRMAVYCATKSYVQSFSRALGEELRPRGISVTVVCPGPMHTEFFPTAGAGNGESRTLDRLPHQSPQKMARAALLAAKKGRSVCTMGSFYKFYRVLAHLLPKSLLMKFTRC